MIQNANHCPICGTRFQLTPSGLCLFHGVTYKHWAIGCGVPINELPTPERLARFNEHQRSTAIVEVPA
jgi:hypothetical protein